MKISIIVSVSENWVIGNNNKLLWRLSGDLKNFRELTSGHPVIMGQKTFESIGKPLPKRTNIILTKDENFNPAGCLMAHSFGEAFEKAREVAGT